MRLQGFLARNGYPQQLLDPASDPEAKTIVERYAPGSHDLPLVICPDGTVLVNPSEAALARCIGMAPTDALDQTHDVAVVGAGPAGLSTAVYAASEGLSVIVFDKLAFGGQAGASARIENYLGFPTGISGQALAGRAFVQAQKFGAEIAIPTEISRLDCAGVPLTLDLTDGRTVRARSVVVAAGARYRRLDVANLGDFEGRGVWYWASPIEARMCRNEDAVLVERRQLGGAGGGLPVGICEENLDAVVRGRGLAETMSRYLVDRIAAAPNIELLFETRGDGSDRIARRAARSRTLEKSRDRRRDGTWRP